MRFLLHARTNRCNTALFQRARRNNKNDETLRRTRPSDDNDTATATAGMESTQRQPKQQPQEHYVHQRHPFGSTAVAPRVHSTTNPPSLFIQAWGQQCSLTCGCVLRFETQTDVATQRITSAKYVARTVVTHHVPGQGLVPVFTTTAAIGRRHHRPWFVACTCPAIHELASHIVEAIPGQTWNWLYNMMDFPGIRASPAMAHAVLLAHGLIPSKTQQHQHCFDLVEEACTAMVKRYIPRPRELMNDTTLSLASADKASLPFAESQPRMALTSPRAMSTLRMYDIQAEGAPLDYHTYMKPHYGQPPPPRQKYDWLDHVDHLLEQQQQQQPS